jgi:hypothetical protein
MARVTRPDGIVAASVWDHSGGQGPLSAYWDAVRELDPAASDERGLAGAHEGDLARMLGEAGLRGVEEGTLSVAVDHPSFEEWWEPFTLGIGPAGRYVQGLDPARRDRLRELCRERLPAAPFTLTARAWAARGRVA